MMSDEDGWTDGWMDGWMDGGAAVAALRLRRGGDWPTRLPGSGAGLGERGRNGIGWQQPAIQVGGCGRRSSLGAELALPLRAAALHPPPPGGPLAAITFLTFYCPGTEKGQTLSGQGKRPLRSGAGPGGTPVPFLAVFVCAVNLAVQYCTGETNERGVT
ncbi:hypothetical protein PLESTF_000306300 [Pleodorina starrii]|nr:hypothetical protein PLESTM_001417100 [Pleodorina starrii]GLC65526.1 hypothetical protein PLESTF_000306300 [Pleodorina starrii]